MPVTNYIWDVVSDNVLMEKDDEANTLARYVQEPGLYGEVISQERNGETCYYNFDGLGNTSELTDEDENVTDTYEYSAFGEEIARTGTTESSFEYRGALGYYTDGQTKALYVRARTYEPSNGRWLSMDPLGFVEGANRFRYSLGSPVNYSDPAGLQAGVSFVVAYRDGPQVVDGTWKFNYDLFIFAGPATDGKVVLQRNERKLEFLDQNRQSIAGSRSTVVDAAVLDRGRRVNAPAGVRSGYLVHDVRAVGGLSKEAVLVHDGGPACYYENDASATVVIAPRRSVIGTITGSLGVGGNFTSWDVPYRGEEGKVVHYVYTHWLQGGRRVTDFFTARGHPYRELRASGQELFKFVEKVRAEKQEGTWVITEQSLKWTPAAVTHMDRS